MGERCADTIDVLIVDDEPDVATLTATHLERKPTAFSVQIAADADEGLASLRETVPDCVVSDYDMPGLDGLEFLEATRQRHPELPFILFTGQGSESVASEAVSAGVTDYLRKGTGAGRYDLLANRITNAVEARRIAEKADRQADLMRLTEFAGDTGGWEYDPATEQFLLTDGACRLVGLDPGTAVSYSDAVALLHPADRDAVELTFDRVVETGESDEGTWRFQTHDGAERLLHVTFTPARRDGSRRVRGAMRDITEQHERRRELDLLRQAIDDAEVAIALTDPSREGNPLAYVNSAFEALTGYDADEVLGRNCRLLQGDKTEPERVARLRSAIAAEESVTVELRNYRKDGTEFWNRLTVAPLYDQSGELVRYLGTQSDVTERKHRERALEETNERLEEFAQVLSHDLRNPLNVASGNVELARAACDSDHLEKAAKAHERMATLVADLLSIAQSGDAATDRERVGIGTVARDAWENVPTDGGRLAVESDCRVDADRSQVTRLFENLFRNSAEHAGADVTVTVGSTADGFYIEDDGHGIATAERERVFEMGYTTADDGTGFGLNIVSEVAGAHGWSVSLGTGTDGGARFDIGL